VWGEISELSGEVLGADFESVARFWVADNKNKALNVCSVAELCAIWKLRNECYFQGTRWEGARLEEWAHDLEMRSGRPPRLMWRDDNHDVTQLRSHVGSDA
jgi:hypothetical protein